MFTLKKTDATPTALQLTIDEVFERLSDFAPETKEYAAISDQLVKLMKLQEELSSKKRLSPDTLAVVAGNLVGIVAILGHERAHVITTKALGFVMKLSK